MLAPRLTMSLAQDQSCVSKHPKSPEFCSAFQRALQTKMQSYKMTCVLDRPIALASNSLLGTGNVIFANTKKKLELLIPITH